MERDSELKNALEELSRVINETIEQSASVRGAVENLRELGFEPNLSMRLEVGLEEIVSLSEEQSVEPELELTPEDIKALRRMRIAF
jgi:hypothetical protein